MEEINQKLDILVSLVNYMQKDLSSLRTEVQDLNKKMDDNYAKLDKKIDDNYAKLDKKIDDNYDKLDKKIDDNYDKLDKKIDENYIKLDMKIDYKFAEANENLMENLQDISGMFQTLFKAI